MLRDEILEKLMALERVREERPRSKDVAETATHWTRPVLMERVRYLREMARLGEGWASDAVKACDSYGVELLVRMRSGDADAHQGFSRLLTVLDGRGTLVTGGSLEKKRPAKAGVETGAGIAGGEQRELRPGDVVFVPAGTPCQILLAGDHTLSYLVVRMKEEEKGGE